MFYVLATASVSGLVAYFLGVPYHTNEIQQLALQLDPTGEYWSETVKHYVSSLAYPRQPVDKEFPNFNPMIYNGEIPLGQNRQPVCAAPVNGKRQASGQAPVCQATPTSAQSAASNTASAASVASAQSVASVQSVASALSVASVQSVASFESIISSQLSSFAAQSSLASVKSASSAAQASLSAAQSASSATSSKASTTTSPPPPPPPPPTSTQSGPQTTLTPQATCSAVAHVSTTDVNIWTNNNSDNGADLETQLKQFCVGFSGWSFTSSTTTFALPNGGPVWEASIELSFTLAITHPTELICVQTAIKNAIGPADNPPCVLTAAFP